MGARTACSAEKEACGLRRLSMLVVFPEDRGFIAHVSHIVVIAPIRVNVIGDSTRTLHVRVVRALAALQSRLGSAMVARTVT